MGAAACSQVPPALWSMSDKPLSGEFSTLISRMGKFYSITVNLSGLTVKFYDSLKIYPMSIKNLAKTFNMDEGKGEIDYNAYRAPGHILTDEEYDYLRRDVQIAARAIALNYSENHTKITAGSNAFADFRKMVGKKRFNKWFPVYSDEVDGYIRNAYRGGFTFCNPKYEGVDVYGGISVDYNSMYPSQMISHPYPVGDAVSFNGKYTPNDEYPLFVQKLTCSFELKPEGVPFVQLKNSLYGVHEHVASTVDPVTLTLSSVDLQMLFENYDVDVIAYDGGYMFRAIDGMFSEYVEKWGAVKKASKGGKRSLAKLFLNSLYGKFGTNPDVTPKVPIMGDDDVVHYVLSDVEETREPVYIPVAVFVTAYARQALIEGIRANYDRFIYCDTDSMHLTGTDAPRGIRTHDTELCAWKVEGTFSHARHLRAKCYIWDLNGVVGVTCAGMPDNIKSYCTFDNFHLGFSNTRVVDGKREIVPGMEKLLPKNVPGGVVLTPSIYELRA